MNENHRIPVIIAVSVSIVIALASCSGGGKKAPMARPSTPEAPTDPPAPESPIPGDAPSTTNPHPAQEAPPAVWESRSPRWTQTDGGTLSNDDSENPSISADGRFVVFSSLASNLVPGDHNHAFDIFVRDSATGRTARVAASSIDSGGRTARFQPDSVSPDLSGDGRFVTFSSAAPDLVRGDTNKRTDVFVRDMLRHTTSRVSLSSSERQANGDSGASSVSADGRFIAFSSVASNLAAEDVDRQYGVFVRDMRRGVTECVSVSASGNPVFGRHPSISADGRSVAFEGAGGVYVRDRARKVTALASVSSDGRAGDGASGSPAISADGKHVAFRSSARNLVFDDPNGTGEDVFVHDLDSGRTELVSRSKYGDYGTLDPIDISSDGSLIAFSSTAHDLVDENDHLSEALFLYDRRARELSREVRDSGDDNYGSSVTMSADGRYLAFDSIGLIVPDKESHQRACTEGTVGDRQTCYDVYVRDRSQNRTFAVSRSSAS